MTNNDDYTKLSIALWTYLDSFGQMGTQDQTPTERIHDEIMEQVEEAADRLTSYYAG